MRCAFRPTAHAKHRTIERGISKDEAIEALQKGAKRRDGDKICSLLKNVEIVYTQAPCNTRVITIYWRR